MERIYYSVLLILFSFNYIAYGQTDTLKINTGLITGVLEKGSTVHVYKGIPYATPPLVICDGNLLSRPHRGRAYIMPVILPAHACKSFCQKEAFIK